MENNEVTPSQVETYIYRILRRKTPKYRTWWRRVSRTRRFRVGGDSQGTPLHGYPVDWSGVYDEIVLLAQEVLEEANV